MSERFARRTVLKTILTGVASLCGALALRPFTSQAAAADTPPNWSFEGVTGPEHWSELSPDYAPCQFGVEQSPIDLVDATKLTGPGALLLDYRLVTAHIIRKSWTAELVFQGNCAILLSGKPYRLQLLQFRQPSEHLLSGRALEMELQFTHRSKDGLLATASVFVRQGKKNEVVENILAHMPHAAGEKTPPLTIDPTDFLPPVPNNASQRPFYRYAGSLTVPPCTEGIVWTIFKTPIEASAKQIREIAGLFPPNARPVSKINQRALFEYEG